MVPRRKLIDELSRLRPDLPDPVDAVEAGRVLVDGRIVTNPGSLVGSDASIVVRAPQELRGYPKLAHALQIFGIEATGRTALDVGAAAGGFTKVLLDAGAVRVYAVDAGHGQLLGSLRADPRVVNLEATNVAELDDTLIPDLVELVTIDVSYLALGAAVAQLDRIRLASGADLVGLVKPMFELRLADAPTGGPQVAEAAQIASDRIREAGWTVVGVIDSPVGGAHGAAEMLVHARMESAR